MRKLCWKWVPRLLTVDQKQQHVDDSEYCLQQFQCNKKVLVHQMEIRKEMGFFLIINVREYIWS